LVVVWSARGEGHVKGFLGSRIVVDAGVDCGL
jgi:hypothetical protein